MSVVLVNRTPRRPGPEMPDGEIQLQEPPVLPEKQSGMSSIISMAPMALGSLSMVFMFLRPGGEGGGAMSYLGIGMMALSAIGMLLTQLVRGSSDRKQQLRGERRDYLRYLSQIRRQVRKSITAQQQALAWRHPAPRELSSLVDTSRLWERRAAHPDFSDVRIGTGPQRLATPLAPLSTKPVEDLEPLCAHALRRFIHAYGTLEDQPIAIHLRGFAQVLLRADDPSAARAMVRAILAQLAVVHGPDELRIAIVAAPESHAEWSGPSGCRTRCTPARATAPGRCAWWRPAWVRPSSCSVRSSPAARATSRTRRRTAKSLSPSWCWTARGRTRAAGPC